MKENKKIPHRIRSLAEHLALKKGKEADKEDIAEVEKKLSSMNKGPVAQIWDEVLEMWNAFKSPDTSKIIKVYIIGSLIYLVSPLDVIPDLFPGAGFLDDVFVLALGYRVLKKAVPEVKKGLTDGMNYFICDKVQNETDKNIRPAFEHFLFWQWIKLFVHCSVFLIAVLILKFSPAKSSFALCLASILLFSVTLFFLIKALATVPLILHVFKEYKTAYRKALKKSDKSYVFQNAVVETFIAHFHFDGKIKNFNNAGFFSRIKNGITCFFLRWAANSHFQTEINKKDLVNIIFETLKSQIISYFIFEFIYFVIFILFIRRPVLVSLTGMNFSQFIFYFLKAFE